MRRACGFQVPESFPNAPECSPPREGPPREGLNRRRRCLLALAAMVLGGFLFGEAMAQKKPPSEPLDLNSATLEQLEQLPGIGPVTAKAIVRFREKSGPFRRVHGLLAIRGISQRRFE